MCDSKLWEGVSSLMIQNEISEEINALAAQEAKKRNIKVFLNAAPAKNIENLIKFVDILLVNEIEAQQISNDYSNSFDSIAKKLTRKISKVIITLGSKGVIACEEDGTPIHIQGHQVEVRSAHGAGDYFAAKFLLEFLKNNTFKNAISVANKKTADFISA